MTMPLSYELKHIVARRLFSFWHQDALAGLISAPVYLFADQQRFDSDEVEALAERMSAGPIVLPHRAVLFEVTDRHTDFGAQIAFARQTAAGTEACLFLRGKNGKRWSDVICHVSFGTPGQADYEGNPSWRYRDHVETSATVLSGIVCRALGILSHAATVSNAVIPKTSRRKLAKSGISGWTWRLVDIDPDRARSAVRTLGGSHASPRWHIRRGHWRRLGDGRRVFVRECQVGDPARGGVVKDYRVGMEVIS